MGQETLRQATRHDGRPRTGAVTLLRLRSGLHVSSGLSSLRTAARRARGSLTPARGSLPRSRRRRRLAVAVVVSICRQSGQFARLLTDPAAEIGQFPQHRRHPHVIPLHRRASNTLPFQINAAGSAARVCRMFGRPPGWVTIRACILVSSHRWTQRGTRIKAPGGSRGTPGATTAQRATLIRERPTTRCPRASARGFLSNEG